MACGSSQLGPPPLPIELWLIILDHVTSFADLAALARADRSLCDATIPILYNRAASSPLEQRRALFWGVVHELPQTLELALAAGIDVNIPWHCSQSASKLENFSDFLSKHAPDCQSSEDQEEDEENMSNTTEYGGRWFAIHVAALKGNIPILERLLRENPRLDLGCIGLCACETQPQLLGSRTASSCSLQIPFWTPLHVAICSGQVQVAETLLAMGASSEMEERQFEADLVPRDLTSLHVACMSGQTQMVEWLINTRQHQPNIDVLDSMRQSPLVYAYLYRHWDTFHVMLNHGADINIVIDNNLSATVAVNHEDEDEEDEEPMCQTMLYSAIEDRRFEDACRLIESGADLHWVGNSENLPLIHLLCASPWDVRPWFASYTPECNPQWQDKYGSILLDLLLDARPDVNRGFMGISALGHAAESANLLAVKRLLLAGASVDGDQDTESPPLLKVLQNPHHRPIFDVVSLLLDSGATINYDTTIHEPALWSLYTHHDNGPELGPITELLLQHGASPVRGTSGGNAQFTTPLEKLLANRDVIAFETLLTRCGLDALGEDDIVGLWRSVSRRSEPKLIQYVLDMDGSEEILRKCDIIYLPMPRLSVQIPTPFELILKLLTLENELKRSSSYLGGIINRAIIQNADPILLNNLLDAGASCNYMYKFRTPLMEVLSRHGRPMDLRKEYVGVLLSSGDCIYRELGMYYSPHLSSQEGPNTALGFALNEMAKDARVLPLIEVMLEVQPLRNEPSVQTHIYTRQACVLGRMRAMMIVIRSSDGSMSFIRSNANELIHEMLDTMLGKQKTIGDLNDAIDCLEFVIMQGDDCLNRSAPDTSVDTRTAKEKLLAILWSQMPRESVMAAMRWCFRHRIKFTAQDMTPEFIQAQWSYVAGVHVDEDWELAELGMLLQE